MIQTHRLKRPDEANRRWPAARWALALGLGALAAACGGGGGSSAGAAGSSLPDSVAAGCSLAEQKTALRSYLDSNYLWYRQLGSADTTSSDSLSAYLTAVVSPGVAGDNALPRDRWSGLQSTQAFTRFFSDGQSLGYGVSVAGLEVANTTQPLRVRYVEPRSPAAGVLQRGDTIVAINGRPTSELTAVNDFSWLEPGTEGSTLRLTVRDLMGAERSVSLVSRVFDLTPVSTRTVLQTSGGRAVGYLVLKDFIEAARSDLNLAFAEFRSAGVRELVLDLRYNGGGLVSLANDLAGQLVKAAAVGQPFASLVYNDRQSASNFTFRYASRPDALGLDRVYVLTGQRTCSASELVINGLKPFVDVVQIGGTTCGKPVGFLPSDNQCGSTISAVNFESLNARQEGRYWDGITATCSLAEDWNRALGDPAEVLVAAALGHVDSGRCPATAANERLTAQASRMRQAQRRGVRDGAEFSGMVHR